MTAALHIGRRCCGPATAGYGETIAESPRTPHLSRWINWCVGSRCMAWRDDVMGSSGYCGLAGPPSAETPEPQRTQTGDEQ